MSDINDIVNSILNDSSSSAVSTKPVSKPASVKVPENYFSKVFGWEPESVPDHEVKVFSLEHWSEEEQEFIPEVDDKYFPNREAFEQLSFAYNLNMKSLLVGPTGSGKTSILRHYASLVKQPFLRINGREDMDSEALLGRIVVDEGSMRFEYGELPKAIRAGWMICFDEPWKVPSGVLMTLQSYFERNGELLIEGVGGTLKDKVVKSKDSTRLFLADNVLGVGDGIESYGATQVQDASTINRMECIIEVPYMSPEEEQEVLRNQYPNYDRKEIYNMVRFFGLLRKSFLQGNLSSPVSMRNYESIFKMMGKGATRDQAIIMNLAKRFPEDERNLVFDHKQTIWGRT